MRLLETVTITAVLTIIAMVVMFNNRALKTSVLGLSSEADYGGINVIEPTFKYF